MTTQPDLQLSGRESSLPTWLPSAVGRERMLMEEGGPLFTADWERTLMLHFEVAPEVLQPSVPFELDVRDGKAYVSLVAFTMRDLAPRMGGKLGALMFKPIATHEFLNVRIYVKHQGEAGIYFLAEWLPNKLSVLLGKPVFGLPYRLGDLGYRHQHEQGRIEGTVVAAGGRGALKYRGKVAGAFASTTAGSLTEFLMERYTAFTAWLGMKRRFRVWHAPWQQCEAEISIEENTLMALTGNWACAAKYIGANYSPGLVSVWMGKPTFVGSINIQTTNNL